MEQAGRLIAAAFAATTVMRPYVVVALMTGARTEGLRALIWAHVDLDGDPPTLSLWRSVRASRDTKTKSPRRTLELPAPGVEVLRAHRVAQLLRAAVDFDTLDDQAVTIRERDSMKQERVALTEVSGYLAQRLVGC